MRDTGSQICHNQPPFPGGFLRSGFRDSGFYHQVPDPHVVSTECGVPGFAREYRNPVPETHAPPAAQIQIYSAILILNHPVFFEFIDFTLGVAYFPEDFIRMGRQSRRGGFHLAGGFVELGCQVE